MARAHMHMAVQAFEDLSMAAGGKLGSSMNGAIAYIHTYIHQGNEYVSIGRSGQVSCTLMVLSGMLSLSKVNKLLMNTFASVSRLCIHTYMHTYIHKY